jgi:hypothetical protein
LKNKFLIRLEASKTTVNVTTKNNGAYTETFNVSVYYTLMADPLIETQTITLQPVTGKINTQDNTLKIQIHISLSDPETYETDEHVHGSSRALYS